MVEHTDNHELQLWAQEEEPWEHRGDMGKIDARLPISDVEANLNTYVPKNGAYFYATDTNAVYRGDGANWNSVTFKPTADHLADTTNPHSVTAAQVDAPTNADLNGHLLDTTNPHSVTAAQVDAPTTTEFASHTGSTTNPHSVTASQAGALPIGGGTLTGPLTVNGVTTAANGIDVADGNIESGGTNQRLKSISVLPSGYVENDPINFRFDQNIFAYADKWAPVTTTPTISNVDVLFDINSSFIDLYQLNSGGDVVIEITGIDITSSSNKHFWPYYMSHAGMGAIGTVKLEILNGADVWETAYEGTAGGHPDYHVADDFILSTGRVHGARWTFGNITNTSGRWLRNIGVIGRNNEDRVWTVKKSGDTVYGNLNVEGTVDASDDLTVSGSSVATDADLSAHTGSTTNPHAVTAAQVGALEDLDILNSGVSVTGVSGINFGANLDVTDNLDNTVTVSGSAGDGTGAVSSVFGRTGDVLAQSGDYTAAQVGALPDTGGTVTGDVTVSGTVSAGDLDAPLDGLRRQDFALNTRTFSLECGGTGAWWKIARISDGTAQRDSRFNLSVDGTGPYGNAAHQVLRGVFGARQTSTYMDTSLEGALDSDQRAHIVTTVDANDHRWLYIKATSFLSATLTVQHTGRFGFFDFAQVSTDVTDTTALNGTIATDSETEDESYDFQGGDIHANGTLSATGDITTGGQSVATDADLSAHSTNTTNPHSVTASQTGAWHSGNDGSGSGLDADTVDGQEAAALGPTHEVVTSVSDTDTTTPLNLDITIPDPTAYQTYEIRGIIQGEHANGDGGEIDMTITLDNNAGTFYDYTLDGTVGGTERLENQPGWVEKLWRRYKTPIHYTLAADSIPSGGDEGETAFITLNSNAHSMRRGLLRGRTGGTSAGGGHPWATVPSIQMSTGTNLFTADLVIYGVDWRSDL